jgi:hypothetical protein
LGAAVVALASLAWNVISWHREGSVVVGRADPALDGWRVTLNNRGRLDTTIEAVHASLLRKLSLREQQEWRASELYEGPELPFSLAAHAEASFTIADTKRYRKILLAGGSMFITVRTGSGKTLRIKAKVPRRHMREYREDLGVGGPPSQ